MQSAIASLRALVDQLEGEATFLGQSTRNAVQPDRAARLEQIRTRIAQIKADLAQLVE